MRMITPPFLAKNNRPCCPHNQLDAHKIRKGTMGYWIVDYLSNPLLNLLWVISHPHKVQPGIDPWQYHYGVRDLRVVWAFTEPFFKAMHVNIMCNHLDKQLYPWLQSKATEATAPSMPNLIKISIPSVGFGQISVQLKMCSLSVWPSVKHAIITFKVLMLWIRKEKFSTYENKN